MSADEVVASDVPPRYLFFQSKYNQAIESERDERGHKTTVIRFRRFNPFRLGVTLKTSRGAKCSDERWEKNWVGEEMVGVPEI